MTDFETPTYHQLESRLAATQSELAELRAAVNLINDVRNRIIGSQNINWSRDIYRLVEVLNRAGFPGATYDEARAHVGVELDPERVARVPSDQKFNGYILDPFPLASQPQGERGKALLAVVEAVAKLDEIGKKFSSVYSPRFEEFIGAVNEVLGAYAALAAIDGAHGNG